MNPVCKTVLHGVTSLSSRMGTFGGKQTWETFPPSLLPTQEFRVEATNIDGGQRGGSQKYFGWLGKGSLQCVAGAIAAEGVVVYQVQELATGEWVEL